MTSAFSVLQTYNAMDCIATRELFFILRKELDPARTAVYNRSLALQAAALDMSLTGIRIDPNDRSAAIRQIEHEDALLRSHWEFVTAALGMPDVNPNSTPQLMDFIHRHLGYPKVEIARKGIRRPSLDAEALEKLCGEYPEFRLIGKILLGLRGLRDKFRVFRSGLEVIGPSHFRAAASFNIAGTETGRWSSNQNPFRRGTNLQNINPQLRKPFCADPGFKLAYIDKEQAESRATGLYAFIASGGTAYLDACESGDLHTTVARMCFRDLPWTGDPDRDKSLCDNPNSPYYKHLTHRDMCKKIGHGTNYYGKPWAISRQTRVPMAVVADFQEAYLGAFPEIGDYHRHTISSLQLDGFLVNALGRVRYFHGRLWDDATVREAIAYLPQSLIADNLNDDIIELWKSDIFAAGRCRLLAQIHDAVIIQYPQFIEPEILPQLLSLMHHPIIATDPNGRQREVIIPNDIKVGWNWGGYDEVTNPDGLRKWRADKPDDRKRQGNPAPHFLDRTV